jgi:hypothetical protein
VFPVFCAFPLLCGREVYALMMMHNDVCVDDERGIDFCRNLDCEKEYPLISYVAAQ